MPTIFSHAALGAGLALGTSREAPPELRRPLAWIAAAVAATPDLDVAAFSLGIPYGDLLGHRGLSHSLVAAVAIGAVAWAVLLGLVPRADDIPRPGWREALVLVVAAASHGLLDMATDGGLGCAVLAPFSAERFFWPVRPIPVSPIGLGFLVWGLPVLAWELVLLWPAACAGWYVGGLRRTRPGLAAVGGLLALSLVAWTHRIAHPAGRLEASRATPPRAPGDERRDEPSPR